MSFETWTIASTSLITSIHLFSGVKIPPENGGNIYRFISTAGFAVWLQVGDMCGKFFAQAKFLAFYGYSRIRSAVALWPPTVEAGFRHGEIFLLR